MQQVWGGSTIDLNGEWAIAEFANIIISMVEAFGTSWNAIIVSLDDLPSGQGLTVSIPTSAVVIACAMIALLMAWPRVVRPMMIMLRNHRERLSLLAVVDELVEDRRRLQRELRGSIIAPSSTIIANIAQQQIPASSHHREDHRSDDRVEDRNDVPMIETTIDPRAPRKVKVALKKIIARNSDNRPLATDASVREYVKERIVTRPGYETGATSIYQDYCSWCDGREMIALKQKRFGERLTDLGFEKVVRKTVFYQNVALKTASNIDLEVINGGKAK